MFHACPVLIVVVVNVYKRNLFFKMLQKIFCTFTIFLFMTKFGKISVKVMVNLKYMYMKILGLLLK